MAGVTDAVRRRTAVADAITARGGHLTRARPRGSIGMWSRNVAEGGRAAGSDALNVTAFAPAPPGKAAGPAIVAGHAFSCARDSRVRWRGWRCRWRRWKSWRRRGSRYIPSSRIAARPLSLAIEALLTDAVRRRTPIADPVTARGAKLTPTRRRAAPNKTEVGRAARSGARNATAFARAGPGHSTGSARAVLRCA